jgi:N-acetylglucosamine malate deacetylase 1
LAAAVAARLPAMLYEYLVWGWTISGIDRRLRHNRTISVDTSKSRPQQRRAIACHHSQTGARILGARDAFRLSKSMIALVDRPQLILLSRRKSDAP